MKIFCVAMNYVEPNAEKKRLTSEPVFFLKPDTALLLKNRPFFLPDFSNNLQYELEVVVRIGKIGKCIQQKYANTYYQEIGLGIDFTAKDLLEHCRKNGLPWEISKGFDSSAPIGDFLPKNKFQNIQNLNFRLLKNGQEVQKGNTSDMIFSIDEIIETVSKYYTLKIGDLFFTGTPLSVGQVQIGDHLEAFLEDEKMLDFFVR